MSHPTGGYRFYGDLAAWWPLISPSAGYREEAAGVATVLASTPLPGREVLELGSGGGHNAVHLKSMFTMTLVDLSADMLTVSQAINPECEHVAGDMRTVRLGRAFDAVFIHDAIDYMITEDDLRLAVETAFVHCRPGGVAVLLPDHTTETFEPATDHGGTDGPDGRAVRYMDWTWDPDPTDTWIATEYAFVFRAADGTISTAHETHRTGLFAHQVWLELLADGGFEPSAVTEQTTEDRTPRQLFVGRRPA